MKKKLLITLTAIMGGVIVVLIAQEMTPEQDDRFDLGEQARVWGADAIDAGDTVDRTYNSSKAVREMLGQPPQSKEEWLKDTGPGGGYDYRSQEALQDARQRWK